MIFDGASLARGIAPISQCLLTGEFLLAGAL
jgi:hypothetical protein